MSMGVTKSGMQPRDKWIPWYIVAFFVVVCSVDGVMAYFAVSTRTGVVTEHHYEQGLHYNDIIVQAEKQTALGWTGDIEFVATNAEKTSGTLSFVLLDAHKMAVSGAKVTAKIVRPTQDGYDALLSLQETSAGNYMSALTLPMQGQWDIEVAVMRGDHKIQLNKRIVAR